jgi:cytochrome c oxidase subunit II
VKILSVAKNTFAGLGFGLGLSVLAGSAFAAQPIDGHINFQPAATSIMERVIGFHDLLVVLITVISLFVSALLVYVMVRYRKSANPKPSTNSHNTLIEIVWTAVPVLILLAMAWPSFRLLYYKDVFPQVAESEVVNIKATGYQWYWGYTYAESEVGAEDGFDFTSIMVRDDDLQPGQLRNLSVDYPMVVPVGKVVRLNVNAADVIHSWTIPAFGVKVDAIPGRLNQLWFTVDKPGIYYGQCSELCGRDHAFMPIEVRALPQAEYDAWLASARTNIDDANALLASVQPVSPVRLASAR